MISNIKYINKNILKLLIILVLLITTFIIVIIFIDQPGPIIDNKNNDFDLRLKSSQEDYPEIEIPENITDDLAEMFMDILWDIDGDSGFDGILPLAFSYIPFLGVNGEIFIEVVVLLSISLGVIILAMRVRRGIF